MDGLVDAKLDRAFAVELLEDFDVGEAAAGILDLRPAEFDISLHSEHDRALGVFARCRWNARRTSPCAASINIPFGSPVSLSFEISPPKGLAVFLSTSASFSAALLTTDAVSIARVEDHGIVRRNFVECPTSRKHRRLPESFDPAAARYPFARLRLIDARFDLREKIFETRRAFEIERHLAKSNAG